MRKRRLSERDSPNKLGLRNNDSELGSRSLLVSEIDSTKIWRLPMLLSNSSKPSWSRRRATLFAALVVVKAFSSCGRSKVRLEALWSVSMQSCKSLLVFNALASKQHSVIAVNV